jgi:hypothetical protein
LVHGPFGHLATNRFQLLFAKSLLLLFPSRLFCFLLKEFSGQNRRKLVLCGAAGIAQRGREKSRIEVFAFAHKKICVTYQGR